MKNTRQKESDNSPRAAVRDCSIFELGRQKFTETIATYNQRASENLLRSYRKFECLSGAITGLGTVLAIYSPMLMKTYPYNQHFEDLTFLGMTTAIGLVSSAVGVYWGSGTVAAENIIAKRLNRLYSS